MSIKRGRQAIAGCMMAAGLVGGHAAAESTSIVVTADTYLNDFAPNNNMGGDGGVKVGTAGVFSGGSVRRGLLRFDLSGLPPGATVTSATLTAEMISVPAGFVPSAFRIHRVSAEWGEGAQTGNNGAAAAIGECTWNSRQHGVAGWTTPGGDFDATPLAATSVSGIGSYSWSSASLASLVQQWLSTPAQNSGLLLATDNESVLKSVAVWGSREGGQPAALTVGYKPPPPPPEVVRFSVIATNLSLTWTSSRGAQYDVLFSWDPGRPPGWQLAEANIAADASGTNVWTDPPYLAGPRATNAAALMYRVRERPASTTGLTVRLQTVVSNLVSPVVLAHPGDGSDRLFVCEQRGLVLLVSSARVLLPTPFLNITSSVVSLSAAYDERGLLGLAFHPGYSTNRRFYVYYSAPKAGSGINHESRVSEFRATTTNASVADPASERIVLRFDEPQSNHNGGSLAFGPDGYLYISTGDGGGANDQHPPFGNAQILTNLLGKILRIDVDAAVPYAVPPDNPFVGVPGARGEIYAYGLRNPWKAAFDGTNCWIADVGQNVWEEIDLLRKGGNYGWRILEGSRPFDPGLAATLGVDAASLDYPIYEYRHGPLGISIIGGLVYRGTNYPALQGKYVFGDFSTSFAAADGALYYLDETRPAIWERFDFQLAPAAGRLGRYVKGFGSDQRGEIFMLSTTNLGPGGSSGDIRQLLPP